MKSNCFLKKISNGALLFLLSGFILAKDYPIKLINQSGNALSVESRVMDGRSNLQPQIINPQSELQFKVWNTNLLELRARGLVTITDVNDPSHTCRFEYNNHSLTLTDELNHMDLDPGYANNTSPFCASLFTLHGNKSICRGVNNCMVVNGELQQLYQKNKDQPLTKNLWLGTHNSTIAKVYAQGKNVLNMSNVDPNQTLTLTQQLNRGARVLELDLVSIKGKIQFCHFHIDNIPYQDVCDENTSLLTGLEEINQWLNGNSDQIILIYLDINQPITDVASFDQTVTESLSDDVGRVRVLSKQDIGNELPASTITPNELLEKYKKNIIFINHDKADNFNAQASDYAFNQVSNNAVINIPYDRAIDSFSTCQNTFPGDEMHQTLWGIRGDQSLLSGSGEKTTITYSKIKQIPADCIINYFALDRLGFHDSRISAMIDYFNQRG